MDNLSDPSAVLPSSSSPGDSSVPSSPFDVAASSSFSTLIPDFPGFNHSSHLQIVDVKVQKAAGAAFADFPAYITVLMSILIAVSFFLNLGCVGTILCSRKLRCSMLYLMFALLALLGLFDILAIMLPSLFCLSYDGHWFFGRLLCRLNAFAQQFVFLASLLSLTLMAMERALGLIGRHLVTVRFFGSLSVLFLVVPFCFAAPLFLHGFPVSIYPFRYLCAIGDGSPLVYSIVQILVYGGCLFVLLLCFGSILKHKRAERSLPVKPQDYGAFIMESRALEEHMIIQGPYICLDFFMQLRNSETIAQQFGGTFNMARDVDTLITLVKLFHPLFVPMLIYASCADIWTTSINYLCCRRPSFDPSRNQWTQQNDHNGAVYPTSDSAFTVFATREGLQLRLPYQHDHQHTQQMNIASREQGVEKAKRNAGGGETKAKRVQRGRRRRRGRTVKQAWK
ncbi:hypothetical protein niasHS_007501 [Heterodera schachtii]|uniref:G-protein coupled receptors family 1 profile domain-containing protein n=1 Tax=Heterodera schachtii TaxID=97005 RepID=A0ABD2JXN3_HETSC